MGHDREHSNHRGLRLLAVLALLGTLLASSSPAAARQGDDPNTTTYPDAYADPGFNDPSDADPTYDDPTYDPAYNDPIYDDPGYSDPCDPAVYPGWAEDPYCNPDAADAGFTNTTTGYVDSCDPAFYPDWASDPACNPDLFATTTPPTDQSVATSTGSAAARTSGPMASRSSDADAVPLTDVDPADAPAVGAERMLLAIDAIAELGGFERAVTPGGAALLRDIRNDVPAAGLDEFGYTVELEAFVVDFLPFLEALEASGVVVSDSLWVAAIDLQDVVFGPFDPSVAPDDPGLLDPQPWIFGLADLLVRGGTEGDRFDPEADEAAIRELLARFAIAEATPETSTTTQPEIDAPAPDALALTDEEPIEATSTGSSIPVIPIAIGIGLLVFAVAVFAAMKGRTKAQRTDTPSVVRVSPPTPEIVKPTSRSASTDAKASVSELLDASRKMSASLDTPTIASIALAEAKRIVGAEGGIVVRRTDNGLDPVGCEPPMLFNYDNVGNGCLPRVVETGRSTAAIAHDEPLLVEVPMAMGAVPIVADGVVTGAILVVRVSAKPFDRDELDALEMLAPLVGSAFAAADTHESATELVDVEPLTGLQNRRRLDIDLAAISTDDAVAYVMVDIDHFKNFNDSNGHAAGDEALRQVSSLLKASVRPKDLVYRYGGEEFCVLLPGATADEAAVVAERARAAVEAAEIPGMENQPAGRVTISVGISDSAFGTPSDLVERADAALYESKRNGRNRVTLSSVD